MRAVIKHDAGCELGAADFAQSAQAFEVDCPDAGCGHLEAMQRPIGIEPSSIKDYLNHFFAA
jgi:hypothetical protein